VRDLLLGQVRLKQYLMLCIVVFSYSVTLPGRQKEIDTICFSLAVLL
jgi:hypothetical protein